MHNPNCLTFDNFSVFDYTNIPKKYTFTFAMIKPHAVESKCSGNIIKMIEDEGFNIFNLYKTELTVCQAEKLYIEHSSKPFFHDLCKYVASGPVILMCVVLKKEEGDCFEKFRDLMTKEGGLRDKFGVSQRKNAVHGSDSERTAKRELGMFMTKEIKIKI
jgi:nucleoside-diphosphate kinase